MFKNLTLVAILFTFLLSACTKEKPIKTSAGYECKFHTNSAERKVKDGDAVYYHVRHRNKDVVTFDSRQSQKTPFALIMPAFAPKTRTVSPIMDVLREMSIGDSVTVYFPLDSIAMKPRGYDDAKYMEYDVVLLDIKDGTEEVKKEIENAGQQTRTQISSSELNKPHNKPKTMLQMVEEKVNGILANYNSGALDDKLETTASGLKFLELKPGSGDFPTKGNQIKIHYYGALTNGKMFDSSYKRNQAFSFKLGVGQVIKGWDEGIAKMKKGGEAVLFLPSQLAYGDRGIPQAGIPGGAELVFFCALEDF